MIVARVIIREQQGKFSQIVTRIVMKKLQILTLNLLFFRVTLFCRETQREAAEEKKQESCDLGAGRERGFPNEFDKGGRNANGDHLGEPESMVTTWENLGETTWGSQTLRSRAIMGTLLGG